MAELIPEVNLEFNPEDYGTHSGAYMDKLNVLVTAINVNISAYNTAILAGEDADTIKGDVQSLLGQVQTLLGQVEGLRDESITLRDQTEAIALADINGTNPDFASVKVNGVLIYHPNNKPTATDLPAVGGTIQQRLDELDILATAGAL